jgi:hypothetical protein
MNDIKYYSLDEAREEIKKRWNDVELKKKVEKELGEFLFKDLSSEPRAVVFRPIATPDNGISFFINCSQYLNLKPIVLEYLEDKYVVMNEEKRGLTKLRILEKNNVKKYINIVNSNVEQGKKISDVTTNFSNNLKLVDFHHEMLNNFYPDLEFHDYSKWFGNFNFPKDYYYYLLLNFVAHGVYFELFYIDPNEREKDFVFNNVLPNLKKIKEKIGLDPIIVKLYPEDQTEQEDFYWFSYQFNIQKYIIRLVDNKK